jgi:hypothetical protein
MQKSNKNNPNSTAKMPAAKPLTRRKAQRLLPRKEAEYEALIKELIALIDRANALRLEKDALMALAYGPLPEDESAARIVRTTVTSVSALAITIPPISLSAGCWFRRLCDVAPEQLAKAYPGAPVELRFRFYAAEGEWRRGWHAEIVQIGDIVEHEDLFTSGYEGYED